MSTLINQVRRVPRLAEAAVEHARLTVVPRGRQRAPRVPFVMLVSVLLVMGVAGLLAFNTSMQQSSFTTTALEQRASVLNAKEQSLQMELERKRDPQQLAVSARRMGMVPPSSPAFIRLADGKILGKATPALIADGVRITSMPTRKPKNLRPDPVIVKVKKPAKTKAGQATDKTNSPGAASADQGTAAGTKNTQANQRGTGDGGSTR